MEDSERYSHHSRRCTSTSDDEERMSVGSRGSLRVDDRSDLLEKGSRAASTLASLSRASSRRGSGDASTWADGEASVREIKDSLTELEDKYRKAMVFNAQLDNEKSKLMYQVDVLKDSLMELEELLSESRREYEDKAKEFEREKHAHSILQFQFSEMKEMLRQGEELLTKHGIVLGPDLNANGETGAVIDRLANAESAARLTQDSQPTHAGESMLGKTTEGQLQGKEVQEGGGRELLETTENHVDQKQAQQEEAQAQDGSAAEREPQTQNESQTELSCAPCSQAPVPDTERAEGDQSDSPTWAGEQGRNNDNNSGSTSVVPDVEEQMLLESREQKGMREKEDRIGQAGNRDEIDKGYSGTEGQADSQEAEVGVCNTAEDTGDDSAGENYQEMHSTQDESLGESVDVEYKEDVRNVSLGNKPDQIDGVMTDSVTIEVLNEEAGGSSCADDRQLAPALDNTEKDSKEGLEEETILAEEATVAAETIDVEQDLGSVNEASESVEKQREDDSVNRMAPESDLHMKKVTDKLSDESLATASQPALQSEHGGASGKKKKKKKKGKQKHKGEEKQEGKEEQERKKQEGKEEQERKKQEDKEEQETKKQEGKEVQERKKHGDQESQVAPEVKESPTSERAEECVVERAEEHGPNISTQALQGHEVTDVEETLEQVGEKQSKNHEGEVLQECQGHIESTATVNDGETNQDQHTLKERSSPLLDKPNEASVYGAKQTEDECLFDLEPQTFTEEHVTCDVASETKSLVETNDLKENPRTEDCIVERAEGSEANIPIQAPQDDIVADGEETLGQGEKLGNRSEGEIFEECQGGIDDTELANDGEVSQGLHMLTECCSQAEDKLSKGLTHEVKQTELECPVDVELKTVTDEPVTGEVMQALQKEIDRPVAKNEGDAQDVLVAQDDLSTRWFSESDGAETEGTKIDLDSCEEAGVLLEEELAEHHKDDGVHNTERHERGGPEINVTSDADISTDTLLKGNDIKKDITEQNQKLSEEDNDSCEEPPECILEEGNSQNTDIPIRQPGNLEQEIKMHPSTSEQTQESVTELEETGFQPKEKEDDDDEEGDSFEFEDDSGLDLEPSAICPYERPHEDSGTEVTSTTEMQSERQTEQQSEAQNEDVRGMEAGHESEKQNEDVRGMEAGHESEKQNEDVKEGQTQQPETEKSCEKSVSHGPSESERCDIREEVTMTEDGVRSAGSDQACDVPRSLQGSIEEGKEAVSLVTGSQYTDNQESQSDASEERLSKDSKGSKKGKAKGKEDCRMS